MKKEEILARSRAEKKDEGTEFVLGKGRLYGVLGMTIMYLALLIFNFFYDQSNAALFTVYWFYLGFELLGRYKVIKQTGLLFSAIMGILAGLGFAAAHIICVVR